MLRPSACGVCTQSEGLGAGLPSRRAVHVEKQHHVHQTVSDRQAGSRCLHASPFSARGRQEAAQRVWQTG